MKATFHHMLDRWIGDRGYEAVAQLLGASASTVHSWHHGKTLPAGTRIGALAAAMGVGEAKLRRVIERQRHAHDGATAADEATVAQGDRT